LILVIDPGREKLGLVLYSPPKGIIARKVLTCGEFPAYWQNLKNNYEIDKIILGNGTGSDFFEDFFQQEEREVLTVDEEGTSEEARKLYFLENPPRRLKKLVPRGLLMPPRSIDDYSAQILLQRFLKNSSN